MLHGPDPRRWLPGAGIFAWEVAPVLKALALVAVGTLLGVLTDRCSRRRVLARLSGRQELPLDSLCSEYFGHAVDPRKAQVALEFLDKNLGLPVGLLRPQDRLRDLDDGLPDGSVDYLFDATAQVLGHVDLETLQEELGSVTTVEDFVAFFARLHEPRVGRATP